MRGKRPEPKVIRQMKLLRQYGHSLPEITNLTRIPKTTVFRYIKGVKILPEYFSHWAGKRGGSRKRKRVKEERAMGVASPDKWTDKDGVGTESEVTFRKAVRL